MHKLRTVAVAVALAAAALLPSPLWLPPVAAIATPAPTIVAITAGYRHTCALTGDGGVLCWGSNSEGQLGDGTQRDRRVPVRVAGLSQGVVAIDANGDDTCALTTAGAVKCWGANHFGQLGNGTTERSLAPADVVGLTSGIAAIAAGDGHTCAVTEKGAILCWGYNQYGELGPSIPALATVTRPLDVVPGADARAIAGGAWNVCAISRAGAVSCWGGNGTLGVRDWKPIGSAVPVAVSGLERGVRAIDSGLGQTCVLRAAGDVACWGGNWTGELGNGTTRPGDVPKPVVGLQGVASISAGGTHTCAVTEAGLAYCWGDDHYGKLGDGATQQRSTPVAVAGLPGRVRAIAAGDGHTCALLEDGHVMCWGLGNSGQLGYGRTSNRSVPVEVDFATTIPTTATAGVDAPVDPPPVPLVPALAALAACLVLLGWRRSSREA